MYESVESLLYNSLVFVIERLEGDIFSNMYFFSILDFFIFTACALGVTKGPRRILFAGSVATVAVLLGINAIIFAIHAEKFLAATTWICIVARLAVRILYQGIIFSIFTFKF